MFLLITKKFHLYLYTILKINILLIALHELTQTTINTSTTSYSTFVQSFIIKSTNKYNHARGKQQHYESKGTHTQLFNSKDSEDRSKHKKLFQSWGVTNDKNTTPKLPNTITKLTEELYNVITNTIYNKQYYDPKVISNIRSKNMLFEYRPYTKKSINNVQEQQLRIGIELDGLRYLTNGGIQRKTEKNSEESEIMSLIQLSIQLGCKLSQTPWEHVESDTIKENRRIYLYFTTLHETIIASKQLLYLRQQERNGYHSNNKDDTIISIYDTIEILCLNDCNNNKDSNKRIRSDTLTLPSSITNTTNLIKKRGRRSTKPNEPEEINKLIIIPQPKLLTNEYSTTSLQKLQSLITQGTIYNIPIILLSPRLINNDDKNLYYEYANSYGGYEPAKFYYPWFLRDFIPPIYTFILFKSLKFDEEKEFIGYYQSVLDINHSWHIFHKKYASLPLGIEGNNKIIGKKHDVSNDNNRNSDYKYIASTNTFSGRPNLNILHTILNYWNHGD